MQFFRFLNVAAMQSGELLNYASVASDAGVAETTVRSYFDILKDTLLGAALEHWILHELRSVRSIRRTHWPIHYWRSTAGHEVDFCLGEEIAVEVKESRASRKSISGACVRCRRKKSSKSIS